MTVSYGCHLSTQALLGPQSRIQVQEVRRSALCNAPDGQTRAFLFQTRAALKDWESARDISLDSAALADAAYAVVDLGARNTTGYGAAVSRDAVLRGDGHLLLHATLVAPGPGRSVAQMLTSPCVVVALPAGRYAAVQLYDQDDDLITVSQ